MICKAPGPADKQPPKVSGADVVIVRKLKPLHERCWRYMQLAMSLGGLVGLTGVLLVYWLYGFGQAQLALVYVAFGLSSANILLFWVTALIRKYSERPWKVLTPKRKG